MRSIKTPGMEFTTNLLSSATSTNIFFGKDKNNLAGSVWQPSLKERLYILLGMNIMAVFPGGNHPSHFYLKLSNKKESK